MVGAFFMPGEIWAFLCPFLRKEVSTVANRIMGITVEIGGDTTKLQTALKGVNGQIKSTQQIASRDVVIYAPLNGEIMPLAQVDDPTFAEGLLGQGIAIVPSEGRLYSPVEGTVVSVFNTKHALTIKTDQGVELLLHIGLDTVKLGGKYFNVKVKAVLYGTRCSNRW